MEENNDNSNQEEIQTLKRDDKESVHDDLDDSGELSNSDDEKINLNSIDCVNENLENNNISKEDDDNLNNQIESTINKVNSVDGDAISDEDNFKDDELDFEEGENPAYVEDNKPASEDGEVDSEELEDGEVKEDDEDEESDNKQSQVVNTNNVCRFYTKGLCTWGVNCRFIHQKPPMGVFQPKLNHMNTNMNISQPMTRNNMNKPNEAIKPQNKMNYQNYQNKPMVNTHPNVPKLTNPNVQYNQNTTDNTWDRGMKFKKDQFNKPNYRTDDTEFEMQQKQRYSVEDNSQTPNYTRPSPYYNSPKDNPSPQVYRQRNIPPPPPIDNNNFESEYERKRRLAFESAPWNNANESTSTARLIQPERHASSNKVYTKPPNFMKKTDNPEQYRDPWRRSKSPSFRNQIYTKPKSDSGSNFSGSESEMIDHVHKKRLDPQYANKYRPNSFRESNNGDNNYGILYDERIDNEQSSKKSVNKSYYNKNEVDNNASYSGSSSAYNKSNELDVPNYERPKNIPPRTRIDSWSDSDSSCSSSSYSDSDSGSESNSDTEPYSRTNKFESTRDELKPSKLKNDVFVLEEPQQKKMRSISDHSKYSKIRSRELNKQESPVYIPEMIKYSPKYSYNRKKQSSSNSIYDDLKSNGRPSSKKIKTSRSDSIERNNGSGEHSGGSEIGDSKKTELLQQLKAIEEAIAKKRSKLK